MTRRCRGCGHVLRRPSLDGYGPVCRARITPAAPSPTRTPTARHTGTHTPAQPTLEDTVTDTAATEPADPWANGVCTYGEDRAPGAGCIKPAGHDGAHCVVPGDPDED